MKLIWVGTLLNLITRIKTQYLAAWLFVNYFNDSQPERNKFVIRLSTF